MNIVLSASDRTLLSLTCEELSAVSSALNEVCNGSCIGDDEFESRMGASRETLRSVLAALQGGPHPSRQLQERAEAWADHGVVMVCSINAFGDPVEMAESSALAFLKQLQVAIQQAS